MMITYGYVWAGLMVLSAGLNLVFAIAFPALWPLYKAVFPITSKLALFAVQYLHIRAVVRPKVEAAMVEARTAAAG